MRCNVCGADNLEGAAYCEDCGARLPVASGAVTQEAPAPTFTPPPAAVPSAPAPVPTGPPPVALTPTPTYEPPSPAAPASGNSGSVTCPACGAQNLPGVAFCEDCGASLSDAPTSSAAIDPPTVYDAPSAAPAYSAPATQSRSRLVLSAGKEFPLDKDTILLGRRSPVDGIFPEVDLTDYDTDSYISRRHGRITRQDGGWVYEDLGSSNGSWVAGQKLQAHVQTPLSEGVSLKLGKTDMTVRLS